MSILFGACGNDEPDTPDDGSESVGKSALVEKWVIEETITEYYTTIQEAQDYYNHTEIEQGNGAYWEFTSTKVTVNDPSDISNGKPVKYIYNANNAILNIGGIINYNVVELTSDDLILSFETLDGNFGVKTTIEFTKQ